MNLLIILYNYWLWKHSNNATQFFSCIFKDIFHSGHSEKVEGYIFVGEKGRFQLKIMYLSLLLRRAKRMLAEKMLWQNRILVWNLGFFDVLSSVPICEQSFVLIFFSYFPLAVYMFLHILSLRKFESWIMCDLL